MRDSRRYDDGSRQYGRDRKRTPAAKRQTQTRRAERRAKRNGGRVK